MRAHHLIPFLALPFACDKKEAPPPPPAPASAVFAVKAITLGRTLGVDKRVAEPRETFGVRDAIYASVETQGAADQAKLGAKWTYTGAKGPVLIDETAMNLVGPAGPALHEFHITRPSDWPKGVYQVEVLLNGAPAMKKTFTVE